MKIGLIGCGYVADMYAQTLQLYPTLDVKLVFDINEERLKSFCDFYGFQFATSLDQVLEDKEIELVINLTDPDSHFDISRQSLLAGKHVYSEKPLAMDFDEASDLVALATDKNLLIASAPCSMLSETAQTMWRALREKEVGKIYAVFAEMHDGLVHQMPYRSWQSRSGQDWPAKNEFEVGCTIEHAGYAVTWLCMMFGPAESLVSYGATLVAEKGIELSRTPAPDFTMACIHFQNGIMARLSCSIVAPHDHRLLIFGEQGTLGTDDTWSYRSPVWTRRPIRIRRKVFDNPFRRRLALLGKHNKLVKYGGASYMDFARGPAEMEQAISEKRPCRMSADLSLHVTEICLGINDAGVKGSHKILTTTFSDVEPMQWAK